MGIMQDSTASVFLVLVVSTNVLTLLTANALMYLVYTAKSPCLERYRISNEPWPW